METPQGALTVRPGRQAPTPLRPSGIVTAFNPASRPLSPDANRRADEALRARIGALDLSAHRTLAHGTGDDAAAWDEPGWCLTGDVRGEVIRLGADFGQNAVLWIDGAGEVAIVCTRDGFCGARVGEVVGMGDGEKPAGRVGPGG